MRRVVICLNSSHCAFLLLYADANAERATERRRRPAGRKAQIAEPRTERGTNHAMARREKQLTGPHSSFCSLSSSTMTPQRISCAIGGTRWCFATGSSHRSQSRWEGHPIIQHNYKCFHTFSPATVKRSDRHLRRCRQ